MNKFLLGFAFLLIFAALPALAQPLAPAMGKPVPQFLPATGWLVKPALMVEDRELNNIKIPCMMMVEYDNGFTLRLSGGQNQLLAMAIDFRQGVFARGKQYQASFKIDGAPVADIKGTAFGDNVLIFNARKMDGIYQSLLSGRMMTLNVESNKFDFALGNIAEAFARLERCYAGDRTQSTASVAMPVGLPPTADVPPPPAMTEGTEPGAISWEGPRAMVSPAPAPVSMPTGQPRRAKPSQMWRAVKGDTLRGTLSRWADKAGVGIDWQANVSGVVIEDMALTGTFEEAVQTLIAHNAAATGIRANLVPPRGVSRPPQPLMPVSAAPYMPPAVLPPAIGTPRVGPAQWYVPAGGDLRRALKTWSEKQGIELFWQANQSFVVKSPVSNNGQYEQALEELLQQFLNDPVRPIAQLNTDPNTGRRILIVQSSRVL